MVWPGELQRCRVFFSTPQIFLTDLDDPYRSLFRLAESWPAGIRQQLSRRGIAMKRLLSSLLESLKMSKGGSNVHRRRRRARLNVECLDERQLMTASLAPGNLLIYYGFPSLINNAQGNLTKAATTLGSYSMVVLGDTLELPTNADHANTKQIIASSAMKNTLVFGYVDTGVSTQNLTTNQMTTDINDWKAMGAKGIFLDDFGYDFGTTQGTAERLRVVRS